MSLKDSSIQMIREVVDRPESFLVQSPVADVQTAMAGHLKVLILWWNWTGYMDACTMELQKLLLCEIDIVCAQKRDVNAPFSDSEFYGYPCNHYSVSDDVLSRLQEKQYDLILICGWHVKAYRKFARLSRGRSISMLCMDNQWIGSPRQYLGIAAFRAYLRSYYDFAFVPGGRQARFANYLGFGSHEIIEGHYACAEGFAPPAKRESTRSFLFVGRLIAEKGISQLAEAWRMYVERHTDPWTLRICGSGPLSPLLADLPHVEMMGFVQPSRLPEVMAQESVLVLPAQREPWGLVVHEAASAGLGLLLTTACGAGDYFLRDGLNGRLVTPMNARALSDALDWFHELDDLGWRRVSEKSAILSKQRSASSWACAVSRALTLGNAGPERRSPPIPVRKAAK